MKQVKMILLGAGMRGMHIYAPYAKKFPEQLKFVAIAEPDEDKRRLFAANYGIPAEMCFESWEGVFEKGIEADAALICTMDKLHYAPTLKALEKGYHVLLEKPMAADPFQCINMGASAEKYNKIFLICHVLRYTAFFRTLKELLEGGRIGRLISIQHNENVGYWHQAHSFVRGNWGNSAASGPMILTKSCHDMDILLWLAGADCTSLSSFGSLSHFNEENAPAGAPSYCMEGCPSENDCIYNAPRTYITGSTDWPVSAVSFDTSEEGLRRALKDGPYGRCIYKCDNNVVDHQVVNMVFENAVTAAFTMCAFTDKISRTLKLMGTKGQIRGAMEENEIEITDFGSGKVEKIHLNEAESGHGGGDFGIMSDFISLINDNSGNKGLTSASLSVQSHLMSFAAEKSRLEQRVINMKEYVNELI